MLLTSDELVVLLELQEWMMMAWRGGGATRSFIDKKKVTGRTG